jgi:hypothetical protein
MAMDVRLGMWKTLGMYEGSCLCGAIRYEVRGDLGPIVCCHCSSCRKAQGTAFATNAPIKTAEFVFVAGGDLLKSFESSAGKERCFCSVCGSPIFSRRSDRPDVLRLRIGSLDTPIALRPTRHIYAASKAEWFDILDGLPQHAELEPGR